MDNLSLITLSIPVHAYNSCGTSTLDNNITAVVYMLSKLHFFFKKEELPVIIIKY